jgi:hypothetical protein
MAALHALIPKAKSTCPNFPSVAARLGARFASRASKHNRKTSEAFVRDVSAGGLGLERVPQLVPDSIVFVELPSGRRFAGTVAWCDNAAAGIRLSKPLLPNDPLLLG